MSVHCLVKLNFNLRKIVFSYLRKFEQISLLQLNRIFRKDITPSKEARTVFRTLRDIKYKSDDGQYLLYQSEVPLLKLIFSKFPNFNKEEILESFTLFLYFISTSYGITELGIYSCYHDCLENYKDLLPKIDWKKYNLKLLLDDHISQNEIQILAETKHIKIAHDWRIFSKLHHQGVEVTCSEMQIYSWSSSDQIKYFELFSDHLQSLIVSDSGFK